MGLQEEQGLVGVAIQFELWTLLVWADGDGHVVSLETGAMWGAAAREVVVFLWWGIREIVRSLSEKMGTKRTKAPNFFW